MRIGTRVNDGTRVLAYEYTIVSGIVNATSRRDGSVYIQVLGGVHLVYTHTVMYRIDVECIRIHREIRGYIDVTHDVKFCIGDNSVNTHPIIDRIDVQRVPVYTQIRGYRHFPGDARITRDTQNVRTKFVDEKV